MNDLVIATGDWQYNAGIVGFCNILKHSGKDIIAYTKEHAKENNINPNYELCLPLDYLDNFTEDYYRYFIDTYIDQISYGKIIFFKSEAINFQNAEDDLITKERLDKLNDYIRNVLSYYMKSASYKAAFDLIDGSEILLEKVKLIKPIRISKKERAIDKKEEIISLCKDIVEIIEIVEKDVYRKYLGGKNIIYNILKNNWNGISILNRKVKEKDIYKEFDNYFVKSAIDYINSDKENYKYNCCGCDSKIKNLDINIGFLTNTGFDVGKKSSHVWDFQNDIVLCEVCRLIYACMPAGFVYGFDKGIFINSNTNIKTLIQVNEKLKNNLFYGLKEKEKSLTYKGLVDAIVHKKNESVNYELYDVQVIFYEDEKYKFNILHENMLSLVYDSIADLEKINNASFKENKKYVYLYEEILKKIFNNENLFLWINKLIHYYISNRSECYYNMVSVENVLKINLRYLEGVGLMEKMEKDIISDMRKYGWHVRAAYDARGSIKKVDGISYRLLNALKTSNSNAFADTLIRCHMYIGKEIPMDFIECLRNDELFKTIGYAFVIGLNGVNYKDSKEENKEEDKEA